MNIFYETKIVFKNICIVYTSKFEIQGSIMKHNK